MTLPMAFWQKHRHKKNNHAIKINHTDTSICKFKLLISKQFLEGTLQTVKQNRKLAITMKKGRLSSAFFYTR